MLALVPFNTLAGVMTMPVPTLALANVPACVRTTSSAPTTPDKLPPAMLAVVVASYTLLLPVWPVMVSVLGVMVAVRPLGWVIK